ncbi:MAG: glycerophosphodiester phosphodiesterase family protein [Lachnospiraceae bacterium]|nr:glycerophosphodiester phosphodiesterase family protein [Lachnospiraceae bacterium]
MELWENNPNPVKVAAHRGFSTPYPENTMRAFREAAALGVDQIETDIRITKDGELVLIHDATVDRTTNGTGAVQDYTLAELQKLDAGKINGLEGQGYTIPTFDEFMAFADTLPDMTFDLELKEYPTPGNEEISFSVCDRVLAAVDAHGLRDRIVVNTFNGRLHEYIFEKYGRKYRQHLYFPINYMGKFRYDPYERFGYCVCMFQTFKEPYNMASVRDFEEMRARYGIETWAGAAVRNEESVRMAVERGAALITTNDPDVVLDVLRKMGLHR